MYTLTNSFAITIDYLILPLGVNLDNICTFPMSLSYELCIKTFSNVVFTMKLYLRLT